MSDLHVPAETRARPSLLGRLDRALPLLVKAVVPVVLIATLIVVLVGQALVRTLRSHVLDTYGLTATSAARMVAADLERVPADPGSVDRLLRRFVRAEVLVESASLYLIQGNKVVFFAGSDPVTAPEEPHEEDVAVALDGRRRSHEVIEEGRMLLKTTVPVRVGGDLVGALGVSISLRGLDAAVAGARERVFLILLVGGGTAVALTGLVMYVVLIRRARRLSRAASQLAGGDLRVRLVEGEGPPAQDELLQVANALNRMVDAVRARIRQQEAVAAFGQRALGGADVLALLDEAARLTADALGVELSWAVERSEEDLFVRAASGWDDGVVGLRIPQDSQAGYTLRQNAPVLVEDVSTEERFTTPDVVRERGVRSSVTAPIPGPEGPIGVLAAQTARPRTFTADDLHFLEAMTATLGAAMQRRETREQLATAEAKYRSLVERIPAIAYTAGFGSTAAWEYVAPQIEEVLGYSAEEWTESQLWFESIHPEDRDRVLAEEDASVETRGHLASVYRMRARDGRWRWIRDDAVVVRDEEGKPLFFQGVMYDITDQKEAEETLRRAYDREREAVGRLQALDEMKSSFLSAVSHELRTPLSSVLGFAVTLQQDLGLTQEERKESIDRLAANAHKLHRLLEDLLDLDRLSRGIVEPRRQPVDVRALALRALEETDLDGRTVESDLPSVVVEVDGPKVERILENLLVNAVKHSPAGTPLRLEVRSEKGGVLIVVEDRGRGVPDGLKDDVFRPFVRGPERPSHSPGAGIGLSLVARFAELHGGRAWVEDRPGGGASFRVFLPGASGPTDAHSHRGVGVAS